jgi:antitoxin ChpS
MLAVPPAYLEQTGLGPGARVAVEVEGDRLTIGPAGPRRRYALADLLAQCDPTAPIPSVDVDWVASGPVGEELI